MSYGTPLGPIWATQWSKIRSVLNYRILQKVISGSYFTYLTKVISLFWIGNIILQHRAGAY